MWWKGKVNMQDISKLLLTFIAWFITITKLPLDISFIPAYFFAADYRLNYMKNIQSNLRGWVS